MNIRENSQRNRKKMGRNQKINNLKIGQYVYDDTIIHSLDPRTKIIGCLMLVFSALLNPEWGFVFVYLCFMLTGFWLAGINLGKIYHSLRKLRYLLVLTFLFQAFLKQGVPVLHIWIFKVSREGIEDGVLTAVRLLIIYLSSCLLTITTSPVKLSSGLEGILYPLHRLGVPVQQLSMMIGTALRFVPTFIEEAETITKAQKSRGAPFNSNKITVRIKAQVAVIIPLLAASLQRAGDLALAMESRCYIGESNHVRLNSLSYRKSDKIVLFISISIFTCAVIDKLLMQF